MNVAMQEIVVTSLDKLKMIVLSVTPHILTMQAEGIHINSSASSLLYTFILN